jgi:hypothetical protein
MGLAPLLFNFRSADYAGRLNELVTGAASVTASSPVSTPIFAPAGLAEKEIVRNREQFS